MSELARLAPCCAPCAELTQPPTDPAEILRHLPAALFSRRRPQPPGGAQFPNIILGETQFGPVGGEEPTPQWELARLFAQERDELVRVWRRLVADQHGAGRVQTRNGESISECPHAEGADLDRVGEQFGVGRPTGFTDCCYWRLVALLTWMPGTTAWLIRELAELYTGIRPALVEAPAKLTLTWPGSAGVGYFGARRDDAGDPGGWFYGRSYYDGQAAAPASKWHGYWLSGLTHDNESPAPRVPNSFWGRSAAHARGLDLHGAIELVKAAGVFVAYVNEPPSGLGGCYGATLRRPQSGVVWA